MQKIHNLIILDASGSMSSIRTQAVNGFNETVQTIREAQEKHPEQQHTVTLVVFNSSATKTVYDGVPAAQAKDMTPDEYRPNCSTPLFDAMGFSINTLREKKARTRFFDRLAKGESASDMQADYYDEI